MIRVALLGYGYWGPNLARVIRACPGLELAVIVDADPERVALARRLYPDVRFGSDGERIAANNDDVAVVVATPVSTHHRLASAALRAGKHVLVAKPLAATLSEASDLRMIARLFDRLLLVDHTFVYTGAVKKIRELVQAGELGDILYVDSVRVNLGLFQHDADVLWDLAPHDLSILSFILGGQPSHVQAVASDPLGYGRASIAYLTCWYPDGLVAHAHVNWLSPVKVRRMLVGGSKRMLVYDDLEPSEKVRVYDTGVTLHGPDAVRAALVDYRTGDMHAPHLDFTEALAVEVAHFADCIRGEAKPLTGAAEGVAVVRVLEAAARSLAEGGARVAV